MAIDPLRCAPAARSLGTPPIGTAPRRTSFLLVDVPLPWSRDIGDQTDLAPVVEAVEAARRRGDPWRLQGVVPEPGATRRRIRAYRLAEGRFGGYGRDEVEVGPDEVASAAVALVEAAAGSVSDHHGRADVADLLVCTHGRRDICCGSSGTALWKQVTAAPADLPPGLRVGRTSHAGGHRFAPTAIHLPSGTCWAWLDAELVASVVHRSGDVHRALAHYRGSCALATPAEQVVEREAFGATGWAWLDHRWRSRVVDGRRAGAPSDSAVLVELDHVGPDGGGGRWTAAVEVVGSAPVPGCPDRGGVEATRVDLLAVVPGSLVHEVTVGAG